MANLFWYVSPGCNWGVQKISSDKSWCQMTCIAKLHEKLTFKKGDHVFGIDAVKTRNAVTLYCHRYNSRPNSTLTSNFEQQAQLKDIAYWFTWSEVKTLLNIVLNFCQEPEISKCTPTWRAGLHEKHVQQPAQTCLLGVNISSNPVLCCAPCPHKDLFFH